MDLPISPIVLTKLRVPAVRERMISRTRLTDLFAVQKDAGLVLVCAPAGYGKTTLLAEWAQSLLKNGGTVIWYSLDPGDNDPIPFSTYLVASFIQALGPIPELAQLAQRLRTAPEMDLKYVLTTLINTILSSERACVLILDDYHLISAAAIHNALTYLCEHRPANLRIALGSRSDPPLPLARLRARGQMLEIRTTNLRFKIDETAHFLNELMQLNLSPQGVAALEERTEGWVTGLQLAGLSLTGRPDKEERIASFTGSHRYLVEYLMEEVVRRQPDEVQAFLMTTAILERLCAPLCDRILKESSSSQAVLEYLETTNLFLVPMDEERIWYRYHHLFRDFLLARLAKSQAECIPVLHRAASEWLAGHTFLREAARHAFQTRDWEYAAAFVEQHSFTLIIHSEMATIYEWCSAFPEEVLQRHPMLCLQQGLALAYNFRRKNRPRIAARLHQVDQALAGLADLQLARGLSDLSGVVRTFMAFAPDPLADPHELLAISNSMIAAYQEGDPSQFSGLLLNGYADLALQDGRAAGQALETARQIAVRAHLFFGIVESSFNLARLAHSQGQLGRAVEICRQGQADIAALLPDASRELPALGSLDIVLGCVWMEQDQLDEAERRLQQGLERMGAGMNPMYLMVAYTALFRLYEIQHRSAEALKYLDHLEAAWPDISFCSDGLRVLHLLRTAPQDPATLAKAEQWCHSFSASFSGETLPPGLGPLGAAEVYYLARLAWIQAQIALGKASATRPYLEQQLNLAAAHGLNQRVIELSLLDALAHHSEGDLARTRAALERALSLAQPEGYLRIFDQGPALTQLLAQTPLPESFQEYRRQILAATGAPEGPAPAQTTPALYGETLSERELEILGLIARGASNQEIADRLVITVGTVKSHINHILTKLDARNRTEAVARARGLGLLEI
jgi:LuxR family maltose regulon positive regulatory protein